MSGVPQADTDLYDAGLSSLTAAKLRSALQRQLGLELQQRLLFELPTVRALAAALFQRLQRATRAAEAAAGGQDAVEDTDGAHGDNPALMASAAGVLLREGELDEANALLQRAAALGGTPLDLSSLQQLAAALRLTAPDGAADGTAARPLLRQMVPILRVACTLWRHAGQLPLAIVGLELLLHSRGP